MKARTGIRSALRKAFAAAAAAAVILGCGGAAAETVRIGTLPASDSILLIAASEDGLFAKEGLDIALVPFRSAMEIGAAMRAGELAGHYGDIMNVLTQNASGAPQKIVATMTTAGGGQRNFALLVSPAAAERIPTLDALKAKRGVETAMSSRRPRAFPARSSSAPRSARFRSVCRCSSRERWTRRFFLSPSRPSSSRRAVERSGTTGPFPSPSRLWRSGTKSSIPTS